MKLSLSVDKKMIKKWLWVWYPTFALIVIASSAVFVFFGGASIWNKIVERDTKISEQKQRIELYKKKISQLTALNKQILQDNLVFLAEAVPYSTKTWDVVNSAKVSAFETGVVLTEWRAGGGAVGGGLLASESASVASKETQSLQTMVGIFSVKDINQLGMLLVNIENKLPITEIKRVAFLPEKTQVDVESKWVPFTSVASEALQPLPQDINKKIEEISRLLSGFKRQQGAVVAGDSETELPQGGRENPF